MSLTRADAKTPPNESLTSSQSHPNTVRPTATVEDDDGWTVQSASNENLSADELKARSDAAGKVEKPAGYKDVRPADGPKTPPTKPAAPAKKVDEPVADDDDDEGDLPSADGEDEPAVGDDEPAVDGEPADGERVAAKEDADADADADADDDEPEPARRRPSRRERRLARIQQEIDDKVAENRRLDRELADRRRRLEEPPNGEERRAKKPPVEDVKPTWKQWQADGKDWDEYQDARDAWAVRQFQRETQNTVVDTTRRVEDDRHARERATNFVVKLEAAKERHADYDDAISDLEAVENTPFISRLAAQISDGPELLYYLGRRINLTEQLSALTAPIVRKMADGTEQAGLNPRHAPILEAVRDSTNPHALLRALVKDGGKEFKRVERLPVAQAFKAIYALESALPAPKSHGSDAGKAKKTPAPPLRPPTGATAASPAKGKAAAGSGSSGDDFAAEVATMNSEDRQRRGRAF